MTAPFVSMTDVSKVASRACARCTGAGWSCASRKGMRVGENGGRANRRVTKISAGVYHSSRQGGHRTLDVFESRSKSACRAARRSSGIGIIHQELNLMNRT